MNERDRQQVAALVDYAIRQRLSDRKWCGGCNRWLPLDEFYAASSGGLSSRCGVCSVLALFDRKQDTDHRARHNQLQRERRRRNVAA